MRWEATSTRGPKRRVVRSATTSAGAPSARGNSVGKSRMPRTSAPRNAVDRLVRVADDGEVAAVAGERPEQRDLAGVGVLVLVDEHVRGAGPQLVAVGLASIVARRIRSA